MRVCPNEEKEAVWICAQTTSFVKKIKSSLYLDVFRDSQLHHHRNRIIHVCTCAYIVNFIYKWRQPRREYREEEKETNIYTCLSDLSRERERKIIIAKRVRYKTKRAGTYHWMLLPYKYLEHFYFLAITNF